MTKTQLALIVTIPLLLVVLLTAANRFWGWPTERLRLPVGLVSAMLLPIYFSKKKSSN